MDYQNQYGYGQQVPQQPVNTQGTALGWEDEVEEKKRILLPEGVYPFRVESFDREQHNGTTKMPPCNVANVHLVINYNGEDVQIDKKLFLLSTNGQLFAFFRSIGAQALPDGRIKMDWSKVPGATGYVEINHRSYNGQDYNNIKSFVDPSKQASTQPTQPQQGWQGGRF